jgi:DNA-binding IscR family transcriptional regulator
MSVKSVQFTVAAHIMAALGYYHGEEISSATLAESVNADPTFVRKSLSKLSKAGLVMTKRGKSGANVLARSPRQITLLDISVPVRHRGVCDSSYQSTRVSVSCNLKVHVIGSCSNSVQLRKLARQNNPGQSGWSDPGKDTLTFDLNYADNKNNKSGGLREWLREQNWRRRTAETGGGESVGGHPSCGWLLA